MKKYFKNPKFWLLIVFILFGILFYLTPILNHYLFKTYAYDYANYNFAFWDYAHFHISQITTLCPTKMTFLQDHFSFTLMFLVPFYWLLNWLTGTYTLLIIQTTLLLISGWAVYKLIEKKTGNYWLALAALIHYFVIQNRFSAFTSDCNIGIISAFLVPIFLLFFELKKYWAAGIIYLLAILSRENMPLWFIFIGIVLIFHSNNRKEKILIIGMIIFSIIYFLLLFKIFIPLTETADKHYSLFNYTALGSNPSEALLFIIKHPFNTLKLLFVNTSGDTTFDYLKFEFYYVYLISGGFLLFWRPIYFIWFVPIIAQKMFNDSPERWGIELYYSIEVATILPIAVFLIISEIKKVKIQYRLAIVVCIFTLLITGIKFNYRNRSLGWWKTSKEAIFADDFFKIDINVKNAYHFMKLIPDTANLSASGKFITHLSQRQKIYHFPHVYDAEYIIACKSHDFYLTDKDNYSNQINFYLTNPDWKIIAEDEQILLLKKELRN